MNPRKIIFLSLLIFAAPVLGAVPAHARHADHDISGAAKGSGVAQVRRAAKIPSFDIQPSCRAAIQGSDLGPGRTMSSCEQDEQAAKKMLVSEWSQFTGGQKSLCTKLESAGGMPSYVELLTCLEIGQAAGQLPDKAMGINARIERARPSAARRDGRRSEVVGTSATP